MDIINFRVSPIGDALELWVEVPEGPNYKNIQIEQIAIQDHNHYTIGYPENPQIELSIGGIDDLKILNHKRVIKRLPIGKLGLLGLETTGMYFMYVKQSGIPAEETPCVCNKEVTIAVAANLWPIYNKAVKSLHSYITDCDDSRNALLDIYVKKNMFLNAIELEDYSSAIYIFNTILSMDIDDGNCLNSCRPSTNTSIQRSNCKTCS